MGINYEKLSEEYEAKIEELEDMLTELQDEEPDDDSPKYDEWNEAVEDIEWLIDIYQQITRQCDYVLAGK